MSNTPPNFPGKSPLSNPFGEQKPKPSNNKIKSCPDCGGVVSKKAKKCPHCGTKLPKQIGVGGIALTLFFGIMIYQCAKMPDDTAGSVNTEATGSQGLTVEQSIKENKTWKLFDQKDEMRDSTTYFATQESMTRQDLGFPYNKQYLKVVLRSSSKSDDVMLSLKSGQFWCPIDCKVLIKFQDEPIKTYDFVGADGGSSEVLFMRSGKTGFAKKLKEGKSYMVEAPIFNQGDVQWSFAGGDPEWRHF